MASDNPRVAFVVLDPSLDVASREALTAALESCGLECFEPEGWQDAECQLEKRAPMLLVVSLGDESELEALKALIQAASPLPVVAFNLPQSTVPTQTLLSLGCADVLVSPLETPELLQERLGRHLGHAERMVENDNLRAELEQSLALLREDQQAGRQVQRKMLPPRELILNDYRFEYHIQPSLFLSGDFIDCFRISDSLVMFYLADISGHGASSAFVTVLLKNMTNRLLRNYNRGSSFHILSPTDVLTRINKELLETGLGKHLTIFVGLLDRIENTLQYAVGGHYPMPILQQAGKAAFLEGTGMPVGLFEDAEFDGRIVELEDRFCLTLFSDGILEVLPQPDLKQKEARLLQAAAQGYRNLKELAEMLELGVDRIEDAPDDIAALSVSRVS